MADTLPQVRQTLEAARVDFEVMDCDPSLADTQQFCEHYGIPFANSANAILIKSKKGEPQYTLCVLLATHRLDVNHAVRKKMEVRKVSFASADETASLTGMEIGGVTPIAIPAQENGQPVPVWVDADVMKCDYIILGGGNRSSKLKVSPTIFNALAEAEVVEGLANPIPTET